MRIGIDARLWNETGVGRYIRNLVENLLAIDSKNEYILFLTAKACQELKTQNAKRKNTPQNVTLIETNITWHSIEEQLGFSKILEKENLDLVHFPYFSIPIFYNKPFVMTIHDLIIHHFPTGKASTLPYPIYFLKRLGYKYVIKKAAQKAVKVIAVSQATKDEIVKHLHVSSDKIAVTYEGVEQRAKSKEQRAKSKDKEYILYVGNAYPHKNLERLIEAFALVVREFPEAKLVLVGKKNYFYDRLEEKVGKMGLKKSILFSGNVSDQELQSLYQDTQALIVPSLMEGFGLPGLEAMQSDCLVLASDIPSLREIYKDAAVYFDPLAVDSLHATIREVLENKKKFANYIEKGKKRALFFSWEKMAKETLKIYESCSRIRSDQ